MNRSVEACCPAAAAAGCAPYRHLARCAPPKAPSTLRRGPLARRPGPCPSERRAAPQVRPPGGSAPGSSSPRPAAGSARADARGANRPPEPGDAWRADASSAAAAIDASSPILPSSPRPPVWATRSRRRVAASRRPAPACASARRRATAGSSGIVRSSRSYAATASSKQPSARSLSLDVRQRPRVVGRPLDELSERSPSLRIEARSTKRRRTGGQEPPVGEGIETHMLDLLDERIAPAHRLEEREQAAARQRIVRRQQEESPDDRQPVVVRLRLRVGLLELALDPRLVADEHSPELVLARRRQARSLQDLLPDEGRGIRLASALKARREVERLRREIARPPSGRRGAPAARGDRSTREAHTSAPPPRSPGARCEVAPSRYLYVPAGATPRPSNTASCVTLVLERTKSDG